MVESYRQRHAPQRRAATQRLGIVLASALVAFVLLGLILRALGAGAVLLGLILFAIGLALGWNARGQREPTQKVATLPVRPPLEEPTPKVPEVSPARAYAFQVLELDTPASTLERQATEFEVVEIPAAPGLRAPEPLAQEVVAVPEPVLPVQLEEARANAGERKKWSPKAIVAFPSSTPESTLALDALETTRLETELETPVPREPVPLERKKWSPKSKVLDTLSGSESIALEAQPQPKPQPEALSQSPVVILEASAYPQVDASARKKWIPKAKRDTPLLEGTVPLETEGTSLRPESNASAVPEPIQAAKLDSRQILENLGIHLPTPFMESSITESSIVAPPADSSPPEPQVDETPSSSGRKKWLPKRKA